MRRNRISLVAMPWVSVDTPSIQLGVLTGTLRGQGFEVSPHSLHVEAASFFVAQTAGLSRDRQIAIDDYQKVANRWWSVGLGDWIFRVPPFCEQAAARDELYIAYLVSQPVPATIIDLAWRMRSLARDCLDYCADEIVRAQPEIVGFTSSFSQNVASLTLAKILKERLPNLIVVFGGANCEGPMGAAIHRLFPWIDFVVRGEGELPFPTLCRELIAEQPVSPQPGLCFRSGNRSISVPPAGGVRTPVEKLGFADYDEYFERLGRVPIGRLVLPGVRIPVENARGCWWGEKHHCTFCGLNGSSMEFRSKPAARAFGEIMRLAQRHSRLDFEVVDNILDPHYLRSMVPMLAESRRSGLDVSLFYETKANLRHSQVRDFRDAGITRIQPGIESLSTPILRMMRKGITALQNIRVLKWAARYGIQVTWNIIYGFPGEPPDEYAKMAELAPSLVHLKPPALVPMQLQRFSPYYQAPGEWGISMTGPAPHYEYLYEAAPLDLLDLAYHFTFSYDDGRDPEQYVRPLREAVSSWDATFEQFGHRALRYWRGPGFIRIRDLRSSTLSRDLLLGEAEAAIYLRCEDGATPRAIRQSLRDAKQFDLEEDEITQFLSGLEQERLVYSEGGRFLSLALPVNSEAEITSLQEAAHSSKTLHERGGLP